MFSEKKEENPQLEGKFEKKNCRYHLVGIRNRNSTPFTTVKLRTPQSGLIPKTVRNSSVNIFVGMFYGISLSYLFLPIPYY